MLGDCTVTFEDGRTLHCKVSNLTINTDYDRADLDGDYSVSTVYNQSVEIQGQLVDIEYEKPKEKENMMLVKGPFKLMWGDKELESSVVLPQYKGEAGMGHYADEKACAEEYYDNGNGLARKMRELELDSDERLLRKYGLVELDGTLTTKGKNFLMNVVFDGYKDDVVNALKEIEDAEKEEKE